MKKVVFVASECVPFIKTGGLADVVGTLPRTYDKKNYDVRIIIPNYLCIPEGFRSEMQDICNFTIKMAWREQYVGLKQLVYDGVTCYFIDNEYYFGGASPYDNMYGDMEKFSFFCKAVLDALPMIDFQPDVIHCHDWQASLIPVYLKSTYADTDYYKKAKTIMTVHNLRFQGICDIGRLQDITGLPDYMIQYGCALEAYGMANMLKGGLACADKISTVSETYAKEICTETYGENLQGLLSDRRGDLVGIVNGIDYTIYNPETDQSIYNPYTISRVRSQKRINKLELQKELGLPQDKDKFVIGIISRLTDQKGLDLLDCVMREICTEDVQFICLGTGEERYENMFRYYAAQFPDRVSANIYYSDELSHKMYAGLDAILMPSQFEPCGLCQLMALRYGTIPIVRETGGLADTVEAYNEYEDTGTGFSFANYNAYELLDIIRYAKHVFQNDRNAWNRMVTRGMKKDYSWEKSAGIYQDLYDEIMG